MPASTFVVYLLVFLFGLTFGSFLNVLLFRFGSGRGVGGRSQCLSCGRTLTPRMLIPLFSYLFQCGRCAYCGAKLSVQYPLVELALGILFAAVIFRLGLGTLPFDPKQLLVAPLHLVAMFALLFVTVYDLRHKIIPDAFSVLFAGSSLVALLLLHRFSLLPATYDAFTGLSIPFWFDLAAGPVLASPIALLWLVSGGRAMGLGDAKLLVGVGWLLGFAGGLTALLLAFWLAFIPSILLLCIPGKRFTMKSEIPFGPFIALAAVIVYAFGLNILQWTF